MSSPEDDASEQGAFEPTLLTEESLGPSPEVSPLPGVPDGRYQEVLRLGRGGMGEVLLCADGTLGRQVAMKVIHPDAVSKPDRVRRFVREARLQGQLEHPSIVPVYDLGAQRDGAPFFTMRRVHGMTLDAVLYQLQLGDQATRQRYTRRQLLEAFSRICLAVDFAHAHGVLHRDLKPANLMLGDFGEIYVLDWGLARPLAELEPPAKDVAPEDSPLRTAAGTVMGTPGYMAPEQIDQSVPLDQRADVYALGAILFELLTFQRLHHGDSQEALLESTLSLPQGRPSERSPDADIPPELETLCASATALVREDRPANARALHEAVERFLEGERDLALRHELAAAHAERAVALAAAAASGSGDAALQLRRGAIRELGQALALDQDHPLAAQTLVRLLSDPPRAAPPEAERELAQAAQVRVRMAGRIAVATYASLVFYLPLLFWMGIRDWRWLAVTYGGVALAIAVCALVARRPAPTAGWVILAATASAVMIAVTSLVMGPFVVQPMFAAVNAMAFATLLDWRHRLVVAVLGMLSIATPAVLGWTGLWPEAYAVSGGTLVVSSPMLQMRLVPTMVLLAVMSLGSLAVSVYIVGKIRDGLTDAERKLAIQAWSLRQLLPEKKAVAPPAPATPGGAAG